MANIKFRKNHEIRSLERETASAMFCQL